MGVNLMVDIEALASGNYNPVILSIGACAFVPEHKSQSVYISHTFTASIDIDSCIAAGLEVRAKQILWWMEQPAETRQAAFEGAASLSHVLSAFGDFCLGVKPGCVWANPPTFDLAAIRYAWQAVGYGKFSPWSYRAERCFRTYLSSLTRPQRRHVSEQAGERTGKHCALSDAIYQARVAGYAMLVKGHLADETTCDLS